MKFDITHKSSDCKARNGVIHTDHGDIETPIFMPVGTQATVKSLDSNDLENLDAQIILANTYHLHLRPGEDLIAEQGGLHKFMNWNKPILTDSGGFQVFSLQHDNTSTHQQSKISNQKSAIENRHSNLVKIDAEGVTFKSYIDGSAHRFTPESAIEIQHKLGADIIMAFDECTPDDVDKKYVTQAMGRTHDWAKRSLDEHTKLINPRTHQRFLFGIIQGANYENLRKESAEFISSLNFDGIAIGGESIGFNMEATKIILDWVNPIIPENKPHYTMGVGHSPSDLFEVVERGVDMFDCVSPTRIARNGTLYILPPVSGELERGSKLVNKTTISITSANFRNDPGPIDPTCTCSTCQNYSRSYLHHLFKAQELTAYRLATIHNVHFLLNLMKKIREAIQEDRFLKLKRQWGLS